MKYQTELKIKAEIERSISNAVKRDNGDSVMYSMNDLNELVLWILPIIIQTIAAPFVTDIYNELKKSIKDKTKNNGVQLSDEDTDNLIYKSFKIMEDSKDADITWTSNWTL